MRKLVLVVIGVSSVFAQTAPRQTQVRADETTAAERNISQELNRLRSDFLQHAMEFQAWKIAWFEKEIQNLQTTRRELEERTRLLSQGAAEWQIQNVAVNAVGLNQAPVPSVSPIEEELDKVRQALREADVRSAAIVEQLTQARARLERYNIQAHRIEAELDVPVSANERFKE